MLKKIINQYLEKGHVSKVSTDEDRDSVINKWYLLVVRKDQSTTKIRIVFDASVRYNGTALNDVIIRVLNCKIIYLMFCFDLEGTQWL